MNLSPDKNEILEEMLLYEKPVKIAQFATDTEKEFSAVMMHLMKLTRKGYVASPEKGHYKITSRGKAALGLPPINKETAQALLSNRPQEKAFYFYEQIGKPLNLQASGIEDFKQKITQLTPTAVDFHIKRGDFQKWFTDIGDAELSKKTELLKSKELPLQEQKNKLSAILEKRYATLTKLAQQPLTLP